MTWWWIASGVLAGLAVGLMLGRLQGRPARRAARGLALAPGPVLPAGTSQVLAVLRSPAVVVDVAASVVGANQASHAFGLVRDRELAHAQLRRLVVEARSRGEVLETELELARGPIGRGRLPVHATAAPLSQHHLLLIVEDRTEARRVEEVRRDFVANISHELKTPVGALHLLAEAVQDAADDAEAVRRFAGQMQRESHRLAALVQEIIDLSRLQVADAVHTPQPVRMDEVIGEAVDRSRAAAGAKRIEVRVGGDDAVVSGDHELLVTAVRNLIDNAVAYSPHDTRIGVGVHRRDGLVEVAVSDQGIGIPAAEQERIFERFYRVDPARSRATGGTGLGLSIVKHVAANHGGDVRVWSIEGQGSTFTLRLPESSEAVPAGTEQPRNDHPRNDHPRADHPRADEPKEALA